MSRKLAIAFFTHSLRSDWNNGNAHFLRGLARELGRRGHAVTCYERESDWSYASLLARENSAGQAAIATFTDTYPDLNIQLYGDTGFLRRALQQSDIAIVHEWHTPEFIAELLSAREGLSCRMLFHDTHHRASSTPEQIRLLQIEHFDGVIVFGEALRRIYQDRFGIERVWTLHEAADTSVFFPRSTPKTNDVVWIGNWGDGERSRELHEYLIEPAKHLPSRSFLVHGVRYPDQGLAALASAGIAYAGYLPNLCAPAVYAASRLTLHVPRQQYNSAVAGIPTIRVFEALASGIPLISAPWQDSEELFTPGDYCSVNSAAEMTAAIKHLLDNESAASEQAARGLATVLAYHTCTHRAQELTAICEEVLR